MANERLRGAIAAAGLTLADVAHRVEVDPKTVERWIQLERIPHATHRWATAQLLGVDEAYLWPEAADSARARAASSAELVGLYPHRGTVPAELWRALLAGAAQRVEWLACAGLFIADTLPHLLPLLRERADAGAAVRIALGDPEGQMLARRGEEEGIDDGLAARTRLMIGYLREQVDGPGVEIRLHDETVYASIFRFDDDALVNPHVYGAPGARSPVLHLRRVPSGHLFDHFLSGFERTWERSKPLDVASTQAETQ